MNIITHRGIDAENHHSYSESSREAFEFFLKNDFSLEFDIQFTSDKIPVISHDYSLERLSGIKNTEIEKISVHDFLKSPLKNGSTLTLIELFDLIGRRSPRLETKHALHLKHNNQTHKKIDIILDILKNFPNIPLLIFDIKPEIAEYIKNKNSSLELAASVSHEFDILRFSNFTGNTLLSLREVIEYKNLYSAVWLDEWDRQDKDGKTKSLYTKDNINLLKEKNLYTIMVSPELHATSPHLLGNESHEDGRALDKLEARWSEIGEFLPDAICTDFPFKLISKLT